jgi:hypothetical protein
MAICRRILLIMKNVSNKSYKENENTHFTFIEVFTKIVPFMTYCGKIL